MIAGAVTELTQGNSFRGDQPAGPVSEDQVQIRCQRTVRQATTLNPILDGGDLSACFAIVTQGGATYPWFFVTCRVPGEARWQPVASVGGQQKEPDEPFVGKLRGPKSFIAIGSLNEIAEDGSVRIELPDDSMYEDRVVDGCCIALAPLTTRGGPDAPVTIRYIDPDGTERQTETV